MPSVVTAKPKVRKYSAKQLADKHNTHLPKKGKEVSYKFPTRWFRQGDNSGPYAS